MRRKRFGRPRRSLRGGVRLLAVGGLLGALIIALFAGGFPGVLSGVFEPDGEHVAPPADPSPRPGSGPGDGASPPPSPAPSDCGPEAAPRVIDLRVEVDPELGTSERELRALLLSTYCDERGWLRTRSARFVHDPEGSYLVHLATQPRAQQRCSEMLGYQVSGRYSCAAGQTIILNADRWFGGADGWEGDLADYRRMLANHEMGHILGLGHQPCSEHGAPAPVMMQQSVTMWTDDRRCQENPWPLPQELDRVRSIWGTAQP